MYNNDFVAGTGGRKNNVAGDTGRKCGNNNVGGEVGRRRCDFVYECLLELLENELGDRNRRNCNFVYECLEELLEDVGGDTGGNNNHCCKCRCPR